MPILIVLSGFLAIVVVGSVLVAVNDALEAFVAGRTVTRRDRSRPAVTRPVASRGRSRRRTIRRSTGRRPQPRDVVVVHTGRVHTVDA